MVKVLIGSSVRQEPEILECFLDSLRGLKLDQIKVDYMFIDDNVNVKSSNLLNKFRPLNSKVNVVKKTTNNQEQYIKNNVTHYWNENLVWKVAHYKNMIIDYCIKEKYDYLFLIDSDLVLHPETLRRLIAANKNIISEIFWTKFHEDGMALPQVWQFDHYTLHYQQREEKISNEEKKERSLKFMEMLREPGVYRVGGLGACTLFSRQALEAGVSFDEIYNLSFTGEDRHLCIRAAALGFELFVDTYYPGYHIYRKSELEGLSEYLTSFHKMSLKANTILISNLLKSTLEEIESFDFRRIQRDDLSNNYEKIIDNFTDHCWQNINYCMKKKNILEKRAIYRAEFFEIIELNFSNKFGYCEATVDLNVRGSERGSRTEVNKKLKLEMTYKQSWKIFRYNVKELNNSCANNRFITKEFNGYKRFVKKGKNKLTLAMLVHNEADRYLPDVLQHVAQYIDEAVILDDNSTDNTVEVCKEILQDIPLFIKTNSSSGFDNELNLRKQLWQLTIQTDPDWILGLDADEMFEDEAVLRIKELLEVPYVDLYSFRLYDFWDQKHYRSDELWKAHLRYWPFLIRYQPEFTYTWHNQPLHCGRFPKNIDKLPSAQSDLRVKHLGWSNPKDRKKKYKRYKKLDPDGKYGVIEQYESILDSNPNLVKWLENISR